ncbi:MAG: hypothetical protein EXQ71_01885 [Acidimicrobiia bacterium]|nr:hypothetical protein [Acidimicrobiia bacterium]
MAAARPHQRLIRRISLALVLFGAVVALWATLPYSDAVPLAVAEDQPAASVTFTCPAIIGGDSRPIPSAAARQARQAGELTRRPCEPLEQTRRVLTVVDLVMVAFALGCLIRYRTQGAQATMPPATTSSLS